MRKTVKTVSSVKSKAIGVSPNLRDKKKIITNQVKLDDENPIPFEFGGFAFSNINRRRYIPFLQPNDDFFKTLLEAKTLSSTQNACIETKKDYCAGKGMIEKDDKDFDPAFSEWMLRVNARNESAHTINRKAFGTHMTFGNTPVEVVRFTTGGKKKVFIYVHSPLEWRLEWPDDNTGIVKNAIHSKLFLRVGYVSNSLLKDSRTVPIYDLSNPANPKNWMRDDWGAERTMIWLRNDMDGYDYYGMPQSVSSLINQVLEYKGARYNLDNLDNNMVVGGLLTLKGAVTQDEANIVAKSIIKSHTGDGKRGRVAVVASEEDIAGSDFHQYNVKTDGSYLQFDDKQVQKIIMANQWDPMLAGIAPAHSMGKGNTFLRTIYDIKKQTVIAPLQEFLLQNLWIPVQRIIQDHTGLKAADYNLGFKNIDPISIIADVDPTPAIKVNEVRAALDLPVDDLDPTGNMYLGQLKSNQSQGGANSDGGGGGSDVSS